jgi:hypothetical protein
LTAHTRDNLATVEKNSWWSSYGADVAGRRGFGGAAGEYAVAFGGFWRGEDRCGEVFAGAVVVVVVVVVAGGLAGHHPNETRDTPLAFCGGVEGRSIEVVKFLVKQC